jgi:hypothetical protein
MNTKNSKRLSICIHDHSIVVVWFFYSLVCRLAFMEVFHSPTHLFMNLLIVSLPLIIHGLIDDVTRHVHIVLLLGKLERQEFMWHTRLYKFLQLGLIQALEPFESRFFQSLFLGDKVLAPQMATGTVGLKQSGTIHEVSTSSSIRWRSCRGESNCQGRGRNSDSPR